MVIRWGAAAIISLYAVFLQDQPLSRRFVHHREKQGRHRFLQSLGLKPQRLLNFRDFTLAHLHSNGDSITFEW